MKQKKRSRRQFLEEQKQFQLHSEEVQLDDWMRKHDTNGDGGLDKKEFAELVRGLEHDEDETVDEMAIDRLFEKATKGVAGVDHVTRAQERESVIRYRQYLVHHEYLDMIMNHFDKDKSGNLDREEIRQMLQTILRDGAKLTVNTEGREYKLKSLEEAFNKGRIDQAMYQQKLYKVQGVPPKDRPQISTVSDDDIDFVMAAADTDKDGKLDRDEVLASLALWSQLLKCSEAKRNSMLCSIM